MENVTIVTNDTECEYEYSPVNYLIGVGIPLLAGVAVLFNLTTLLVMFKFCGRIRNHYVLIVVQCSADLLAALSYMIFYLTPNYINVLVPAPSGWFYCLTRFLMDMINASFALSLMNILVITLDRLVAIYSPLKYQSVARTSRLRIIAAIMALISLIFSWIPFLTSTITEKPNNYTLCENYFQAGVVIYQIDQGLIVLDTLVMIVVYGYILDKVRRRPPSRCNTGSTYRTTLTSFWIVVTFIVFYWPDIISNYVIFTPAIVYIVKTMPLVNCIADPLIYAIRLKRIKLGFRKLYSKINYSSGSSTRTSKLDGQR
ncbi:hypothetical protein LSH36_457g00013 [Paralvinella palmiformis]|uniref:G-protein coupled receptors family 1 profile domain-containing protein n=1 Tax=Paralvinella palmiformis TaxID=53620 RepID=A0AAD9J9U1_9ANNE|nr:hypothetical protein LSH36_457g00013 [Paralvinella palmiformis]